MELVEMDLMQAQIGELTAELTGAQERLKKLEEGGGGGGANQYIVQLGTTTPRMVYEAIQQGKSIGILQTTSEEVTDTFPGTSDIETVVYNNVSDATPVMMKYQYVGTETMKEAYGLLDFYKNTLGISPGPDEPFAEY